MAEKQVVVSDGIRTAFGKARPDGLFARTLSTQMAVHLVDGLVKRNNLDPKLVGSCDWGVTAQMGDQATLARAVAILSVLGYDCPATTMDRMCASGLTALTTVGSAIRFGAYECGIAGGVEHMGHHPMGAGIDPDPRLITDGLVTVEALNMGITAENLHDMFPDITREQCDEYAVRCQEKAKMALDNGYIDEMILPMMVYTDDGWKLAFRDEQPRPGATLEGMRDLRTPFRVQGRVTPGNASGLNDGAAAVLMSSASFAKRNGLTPIMKMRSFANAGVNPAVMGIGPIPATHKALANAGLTISDIDYIELNEAFAVQAIAFQNEFGINEDDDIMNPWGGAIAFGHPLASSGPRLAIHAMKLFEFDQSADLILTTMCVGLGQGVSVIWERCN